MNSLLWISLFILSKFRTKLAANHLIIKDRTKYDTVQKSSKFLLEITTLVSSANNTVSDTEFVLWGRTLMNIMNNRGSRIDPWGTPCFNLPQPQEKFWAVLHDFTSTLSFPSVQKDLNQSSDTPQIPQKYNLANKTEWYTQPKAFVQSQKIPPTCTFR